MGSRITVSENFIQLAMNQFQEQIYCCVTTTFGCSSIVSPNFEKKSPNNSKRHPPPPSAVVRRGARCVANSSPRLNAQVLQTLGRTEYAGEFRTWHSDIYAIGQVEAWVLSSRRVFEAIFVLFGMKSVASRSTVYCTLLSWFVVTCEFCLLWKFSWLRFSYSSSVLICRTLEKANENRLNGLK